MACIVAMSSPALQGPRNSSPSLLRCGPSRPSTRRNQGVLADTFGTPIRWPQTSLVHPRGKMKHRRACSEDDSEDRGGAIQEEEEVNDLGVKVALSMLKFYKREISPLLPSSCRYVPTCSEYSMQAYKKYGVAKGTILTAWRLCRCNPLGGSGFDPPRWFDEETPTDPQP